MKPLFESAGVEVVVCPRVSRMASIRFLREQIHRERPDVWHTHLGADLWGGWAGFREGIHPWVVTLHNEDRDLTLGYHLARRVVYQFADQIVCVSSTVKQFAQRRYHVQNDRLSVIPNGIDLSRATIRPSHSFHDIPRLVSVGRLTRQKDHAVLLKALSLVRRPWQLDILGDGPERFPLQELAASLGILPRVRFFGSVDDVSQRLSSADLLCFPSRWEGQGIALLEAASSCLPILASDLPAIREMFDDYALTFVAPGAVAAWAEKIEKILADPSTAMAKTVRAAAIVNERFTLDASVEKYARLYRRLLGRGGKI